MAGGGGTRLWPASRKKRPKQFLPLLPGGRTLLGATVERTAKIAPPERTLVVTAAQQVDDVLRTAPSVPRENIVIEPQARNTAACIGLGALEVLRRDPGGVVAVVPSDQHATRPDGYAQALVEACAVAARAPVVVTVGIKPTGPETGYGYLEVGAARDGAGRAAVSGVREAGDPTVVSVASQVQRFVEKPDRATAEKYLRAGNYLWNSGMFFFAARRIIDEIRRWRPDLGAILDGIAKEPARVGELYPQAPSISIDYAVAEKLGPDEIWVVPGDFGWSDVGSWSALAEVVPADAHGNHALADAVTVDAHGNVLYAEGKRVIAAVGVHDLVIVATDEAVLVLPKDRAQDVKEIVRALESTGKGTYL